MRIRLTVSSMCFIVGTGILVAGVVATFVGKGEQTALIVGGAVVFVAPLLASRLEELSVGPRGFTLRLSREIAEVAGGDTARKVDRSGVAEFANAYALVHADLAYEDRGRAEDAIVRRAADLAFRTRFEPRGIRNMFENGSPVMRVLSLGLMEGDPSLADMATVISALSEPRSRNEQYHGLELARDMLPSLHASDRERLRSVVKDNILDNDAISGGSDRAVLARKILGSPREGERDRVGIDEDES